MRLLKQIMIAIFLVIVFMGTANADTVFLVHESELIELAEAYIELGSLVKSGEIDFDNVDVQMLVAQSSKFLGFVAGVAETGNGNDYELPEGITVPHLAEFVAIYLTDDYERQPKDLLPGSFIIRILLMVQFPINK